jgi:hypothetical protein
VEGLKARRGDLSGPVLAILVTLVLLAIGATIIAYFTLFAGPAPTPILVVRDQPTAFAVGSGDARVEVVVTNVGSAKVTLHGNITRLKIVSPSALASAAGEVALGSNLIIAPGESRTLVFTFNGVWSAFSNYRSAGAVLILRDTAGNTIDRLEVNIRIIGGG